MVLPPPGCDRRGPYRSKIAASLAAIDGGVSQVHILDGRIQHSVLLEIFTPEGIGTMITEEVG